MSELITHFLQSDDYLMDLAHQYGALTYLILFLVIFSETGLVVVTAIPLVWSAAGLILRKWRGAAQ